MYLRVTIACMIAVAGTTATLAQETPAAAPDVKPAKPHRVCRQDVATGSIMPRTTCHTKDEWAAIDASNQAQANQELMHRSGTGTPGH
jgi:hypothetical protein